MKFIDLFSGIGGFRMGLERAGHECVGHIEIDKFANQSYAAIHKPREDEFFHDDITTIGEDELQNLKQRGIDIITGGFPCQAFSIAGHRKGFDDIRGTLFFDIARLAKEIQPKYLLLENVKGLLNHDKGNTFEVILRTLDEIGYDTEWEVLNSEHFGVPQNRERVFIIGLLRGAGGRKVFPITSECQSVDGLQGQHVGTITTRTGNSGTVGTYIVEGEQFSQKIKQRGRNLDNPSDQDNNFRIRKLTPRECWRLQGFPDWAFERAAYGREIPTGGLDLLNNRMMTRDVWKEYRRITKKQLASDSQLYKQAGNSVTVNVIHEIAKRLK